MLDLGVVALDKDVTTHVVTGVGRNWPGGGSRPVAGSRHGPAILNLRARAPYLIVGL